MKSPLDHSEANALLPWLVNGTLRDDERALVDEHVRGCVRCRIDLKKEQHLRAALREHPAIHVAPQRDIERLMQSLDAPLARPRVPWIGALAAGVAAAVLGAGIWLAAHPDRDLAEYSTLTVSDAAGDAASIANELDVVFAPSITVAQIEMLLGEIHGTIVAGPSDIGRYRVRLDSTAERERSAAIAKLAAEPLVQFAGPAMAGEAREIPERR